MDGLLTYKDVARLLKVSDRTVWELVKKGKLKAYKVQHQVRIRVSAVEDYLRASAVKSRSDYGKCWV